MEQLPSFVEGITAVLLCSAFVKVALILAIFRLGLGLEGMLFGVVTAILAIGLTLPTMLPEIKEAGSFESYLFNAAEAGRAGGADSKTVEQRFRPYIQGRTELEIAEKFQELAAARRAVSTEKAEVAVGAGGFESKTAGVPPTAEDQAADAPPLSATNQERIAKIDFPVLVAAFLISELRVALYVGLLILLPFLVIDLLLLVVSGSLGVSNIPHHVLAVPAKLLLFFAVDGWTLIAERILGIG